MSNLLKGYDMVIAITEKAVNDQFYRLATSPTPTIVTLIKANDLSSSWGNGYILATTLRGYIDPPSVQFYNPNSPDSHDQVLFQFVFATRAIDANNELKLDLSTFIPVYDAGSYTDGYIIQQEDIPYVDENGDAQILANQNVYYYIRATTSTVGTTYSTSYELVPSTYFESENMYALVDLTGLQTSFTVNLSVIPTTPEEIQTKVDDGIMSELVLSTINENQFTSDAFSITQLFLDFDTVDFTQWSLTDPAAELGGGSGNVTIIFPAKNQYLSEDLDTLISQNKDFTTDFSTSLEDAFGLGSQDNVGATPYILNVNISSDDPAKTNPDEDPSLVPTYISYGTTHNANNSDLDTLNYQVMGGAAGASRAPVSGDGATIYISDNLVANTDYSGKMLYDSSILANPYLLNPLKQSLYPNGNWTQNGRVFTASEIHNNVQDYYDKNTILGTGYEQIATHDTNNQFLITVNDNNITITGSLYQKSDIYINAYFLGWDMDFATFHWWQTYTITFSQKITWSINTKNELIFNVGDVTSTPNGPILNENFGASITDDISELFSVLSFDYFDPVQGMLDDQSSDLINSVNHELGNIGDNLASGISNKFISPTGEVFFLANPKIDDELNFTMDVTYDI